jgi:hypothetical protein
MSPHQRGRRRAKGGHSWALRGQDSPIHELTRFWPCVANPDYSTDRQQDVVDCFLAVRHEKDGRVKMGGGRISLPFPSFLLSSVCVFVCVYVFM